MPGLSALQADGAHVTFAIAGALDPVVKAIARHTIVDIDFARPTLEEVFLTYYRDQTKDATA